MRKGCPKSSGRDEARGKTQERMKRRVRKEIFKCWE